MEPKAEKVMEQIKTCLERTMHEYEVAGHGSVYVCSGLELNTWVTVPQPTILQFYTYLEMKDGLLTDEAQANALVNRINDGYLPNSVSQRDGHLVSTYCLPLYDGFSERSFIHMLRRFAQALRHAVLDEDVDGLCGPSALSRAPAATLRCQ